MSFHQKFQKDFEKLEAQQAEILDGQTPETIDLCFKIIGFFQEEQILFNNHAKNNDYQTYGDGYLIAF